MEPVFSSPKLVRDFVDKNHFDWADKNGDFWFCGKDLGKLFEIHKKVKSIRVHAFEESPHKDAVAVRVNVYYFHNLWESEDNKAMNGQMLFDNLYNAVETYRLEYEKPVDEPFTVYLEVEIIKEK